MICYMCKNNIPKDAAKCPVCGVKAMPFVGAKTCPNCGTVNPVSARFCISDGYSFEEAFEEAEAGEEVDEYDEGDYYEEEMAKAKPKKRHGVLRLFMWLFIAVFCLVGSAVVGYNVFKPKTYLLESQAMEALAGAGLHDVSVKVDLSKTAKLAGTVKTADEKAFAEVIVKKVPKILKVENNIMVTQVVPKPEELEKTINKSLNSQGFPGIVVSVNTALAASIIGTVTSEYDRNKVLSIVKGNRDVKDIKDNLHVDASLAQPAPAVAAVEAVKHPAATPEPEPDEPAATPEPTPSPVHTPHPTATPVTVPKPMPEPMKQSIPMQQQQQPTAIVAPQPEPGTLEGAVNKALKSAGLTKITAQVDENLDVTLKGTVSGSRDKNKAFDATKHIKGVRKIKDKIFVVEQ
ncbi:MAG: BON domain-containing protein [Nitrospirae bacterium]|nr:BON domain-containing protein [Nitrospirota bacterium]